MKMLGFEAKMEFHYHKEGKSTQKSKEFHAREKSKEFEESKARKIRVGRHFRRQCGPGYPDVWVPDVPGISRPKTLCLGCFFRT